MTESTACPQYNRISDVLSRVGDRWSLLIMISLTQYGTLQFNALKRNLNISQRMLSLTLRELKRDGLVHRELYPTIPPKVEYSLTKLGKSFCEPVSILGKWALENLPAIDEARERFDQSTCNQKKSA